METADFLTFEEVVMETLAFLAFGGFWFWVFAIAASLALLALVENEHWFWSTTLVVATLCILQWVCGVPVLQTIIHHPLLVCLGFMAYFVPFGVCYGILKWQLFCSKHRRFYDEIKADFLQAKHLEGTEIPEGTGAEFKDYFNLHCFRSGMNVELKPKIRKHKGEWYLWVAFWPWSCAWTMLNDPIRRICDHLYNACHNFMQAMSDRTFRGTENDFKA